MKNYPGFVLVAAAVLTWAFIHGMVQPDDVGWQFWIARQILGGSKLYTEIWDLNPPLWFWSAMPLEWLSQRTGIAWGTLLTGVVVLLGTVCAWLTAHLLNPRTEPERLAIMLLVFAMTVIMPAALTGQRDQLVLIVSLSYASLIARRQAGVATAPMLAVGVAVLAAYGFALKPHFLAAPLLLEGWVMVHQRGRWRPWRPELIVLSVLALAYAVAVAMLARGLFTVILPMADAGYFAVQASLVFTLIKPYVVFWAIAGLFLWVTRREALRAVSPATEAALPAMLLVWLGFAISYVVQKQGWDYHAIPATGAMAVALGLRVMRRRAPRDLALGGALLAAVVALMFPYRPARAPEDPLLDKVAPGEGVFIANFDASAVFRRGRENIAWVSRNYSLRIVYAIAVAEAQGRTSPALKRLEGQLLAAMSEDIRCNPPQLIVMQASPGIPGRGGAFSFDEFMLRDPVLRAFIAAHYAPPSREPIGTVYWRRGPVARVEGLACREIF